MVSRGVVRVWSVVHLVSIRDSACWIYDSERAAGEAATQRGAPRAVRRGLRR
jgi:hypothetical protein